MFVEALSTVIIILMDAHLHVPSVNIMVLLHVFDLVTAIIMYLFTASCCIKIKMKIVKLNYL